MSRLSEYGAAPKLLEWGDYRPYVLKEAADAAIESLKCCAQCTHVDHDAYSHWWCEYDDPTDPTGNWVGTLDPHENCHFTPSRWKERS